MRKHIVCMRICCIPCREVIDWLLYALGSVYEQALPNAYNNQSIYLPARDTTYTHTHNMLPHHRNI